MVRLFFEVLFFDGFPFVDPLEFFFFEALEVIKDRSFFFEVLEDI